MKTLISKVFGLMVIAAFLLISACEKQEDQISLDSETKIESRSLKNSVVVVGHGYYSVSSDGSLDGCPTGFGVCLYEGLSIFNGTVDEAIEYVNNEGPESCVSILSVKSGKYLEMELVYATSDYEQSMLADGIDMAYLGVGPEEVVLDAEIAEALGMGLVTIEPGQYKVIRDVDDLYWKGSVSLSGVMGPMLLIDQINGASGCFNSGNFDAFGARYIVDPVTFAFYYVNFGNGLDLEVKDLSNNIVISEFDDICRDGDNDRRTMDDFICGAVGFPITLDPGTTYRLRLHIAGYPSSSPWYYFTTPTTLPCSN